jgi:hypothetical protein
MKIHGISEILDTKLFALELIKDSPLVLYVAFYEPLHSWLTIMAEEWNPVLQLLLNIIAVLYGVARLVPIFKSWFGKEEENVESK